MDIQQTIEKLKAKKTNVNSIEFEVWLNSSYAIIESQFKSYDTRARSFSTLISDYRIKKIGSDFGINSPEIETFKKKAIQYIDDCIEHLNDLKNAENEKSESKNMSRVKSFDEFSSGKSGAKTFPAPPPEQKVDKKPWGLKPKEFYTIISGIILAVFFLGKFEEKWSNSINKSDYENRINKLENRVDSLNNELKVAKTNAKEILIQKNKIEEELKTIKGEKETIDNKKEQKGSSQ